VDAVRDRRARFVDEADEVAAFHVRAHYGEALAVLAVDDDRTFHMLDAGDLAERNRAAIGQCDELLGEHLERIALRVLVTQYERHARAAFDHGADTLAFDAGAQPRLQFGGVEPELAGTLPVDRHLQVLRAFVDRR